MERNLEKQVEEMNVQVMTTSLLQLDIFPVSGFSPLLKTLLLPSIRHYPQKMLIIMLIFLKKNGIVVWMYTWT